MAVSVLHILKRVARRLLLVRAAEAAAVAAIALGAVSAILMAGRIVAGPHPGYAVILALLPLLAIALALPISYRKAFPRLLRRGFERLDLSRPVRLTVVTVSGVAAVAAIVLILTRWFVYVPHWLIPLVLVPAAGAAAAASVVVRGVSLAEAALHIDRGAGLAERLITALELEPSDMGFALAVREQAVSLAGGAYGRVGYWRRTRTTSGLLALTAMACILLATVSPQAVPGLAIEQQWEQTRQQKAEQLASKAEELRRKAEEIGSPQLRHSAEVLKELSKELVWGKEMPPEKAVGQITSVQNELKAAIDRQRALKDAAEALKKYKATEALARSAVEPTQSPDSAANELSKAMSGQMSPEQRQRLAGALDRAADAATGDPRLASALRDAARAVDQQNAENLGEAMAQAASAMGDTKTQASSGSAQAMGQALNDLEEQKQGLAIGGGLTREDIEQAIARAGGNQGAGGQGDGSQGGQSGNQSGQQGPAGTGQGNQSSSSGDSPQAQGNNGQGPGQSGSQGNRQNGQGAGSGGGQPGGGGAVAGGSGSTNLDNPSGPGDQFEGEAYNEGKWARVYAPKAIESQGPTDRVMGNPGEGMPVEQAPFYAPAQEGQAYVPYDQAWQAARTRAEQSISRQRIPARLRKLIQEYYMLDK